jgi:hypothetical protein
MSVLSHSWGCKAIMEAINYQLQQFQGPEPGFHHICRSVVHMGVSPAKYMWVTNVAAGSASLIMHDDPSISSGFVDFSSWLRQMLNPCFREEISKGYATYHS